MKRAWRRYGIAGGISLLLHIVLLAGMALRPSDVHDDRPVILVTLEPSPLVPPKRKVKPPLPEPRRPPPSVATRPPENLPSPVTVAAAAHSGPGQVTGPPGNSAVPEPAPDRFFGSLGCSNTGLSRLQREECNRRYYEGGYARMAGYEPIPDHSNRARERAETAARKDYRQAPVSLFGNASPNGCPGANMGTGCVDDMAWPLASTTGQTPREFRNGRRNERRD